MDMDTLLRQVTLPPTRGATVPRTDRVPPGLNPPQALVLVVSVVRCEGCGHVTRGVNPHMLVRYGARTDHAQSVQHTRADVQRFMHLPREVREWEATSPFCEECF